MKLTVAERLSLLGILPEQSDYAGVREIYRTRSVLGLTGEEAQAIDVQPLPDGRIQWDQEKALDLIVDIPLGEWITEVIRGELREKDRKMEMTPELMSLYEKFIFDYE